MIESPNDETNFPHKLLLTNTQVSKICKAFANGSFPNIKFSKTQLSKMIPSEGFMIDMFTQSLLGPPTEKLPEPSELLIHSYIKEIKTLATNNNYNNNVKDVFLDAGLSLLGKNI